MNETPGIRGISRPSRLSPAPDLAPVAGESLADALERFVHELRIARHRERVQKELARLYGRQGNLLEIKVKDEQRELWEA